MGHININLGAAKNPFEPVPDGNYTFEIMDVSDDPSKAGDAMLTYECEIVEPEEFAGKKVFERCMLEGKGATFGTWRVSELFRGTKTSFGSDGFDPTDLVGKQFRAHVIIEPSNDPQYGDQNRIKEIL